LGDHWGKKQKPIPPGVIGPHCMLLKHCAVVRQPIVHRFWLAVVGEKQLTPPGLGPLYALRQSALEAQTGLQ
jgi:hypothetical protein